MSKNEAHVRYPRISDANRHHPSDHPQEVLRDALRDARRFMTAPKILAVVESAGFNRPFGPKSLEKFIDNETKEIEHPHYEILARVWLRHSGARALRFLDVIDQPDFEKLANVLASGQLVKPTGLVATGRYFMYHGSYLAVDCFVVRAIEIDCIEGSILTVTDKLDDRMFRHQTLVANGVATFVKGLPQLLFDADENKNGLSLIVSTAITPNAKGEIARIAGAFLAVTNPPVVVERSCLLLRAPEPSLDAMIGQTGIFTRESLRARDDNDRHANAFDELARSLPQRVFADPILAYRSKDKSRNSS